MGKNPLTGRREFQSRDRHNKVSLRRRAAAEEEYYLFDVLEVGSGRVGRTKKQVGKKRSDQGQMMRAQEVE
jgi:hypothetical protein